MTEKITKARRLTVQIKNQREIGLRSAKTNTLFMLGSVYSTKSSVAEKITEKNNSNITLRWFDTVFSGPYLAFSIGVLSTLFSSDQCGNYTSTCKKIKVWLNVFFKVMDISMETRNQKYENR